MAAIDTQDPAAIRKLSDEATRVLLNKPNTLSSTQGGWMMIATILIEAWDLYAIAFVLIFIKTDFNPTAAQLGLATAAVQGGALIGALLGGVFADYFGRKKVFIGTMILFIVLALAQAFVRDIWELILIRFLIGIPLGSDISNGYAYIMESMSKGKREQMGSRWQFMFGLGEVFAIIIITVMYISGMDHSLLWRVALALGAVPAAILLFWRLDLPETPLSLLQRGHFRKAKEVSKRLFDDPLDMLPNQDVQLAKPKLGDFLKVIWADPIKKRATIFSWISNACQGAEFTAWGFYLPVILVLSGVGVSSDGNITGTNMVTALIFCLATISGYVAPLMLPKIGHRGVAMWGFGLAFLGLILGGLGIQYDWKIIIVVGACILMWGHYWDASNGMTISSMVAPSRFKATASGFGYVFVKGASFFGAFVFPILSEQFGKAGATFSVAILSLIGFLAAKFILPEVYGYVETEELSDPR
ncbi:MULTISPECIES: MFS transporter [unclassified Rhizobium]|uniref:MFS transporter n=1 Tax=unclassified Rhizobium TaxID=2613769 RepID=UPI000DDF7D8C|nr:MULTISPECIES: MFS transporter [unclassified Rhizobium]MBB3286981.1 MFS family permease [Rhizobium sp. BK252]MBB3401721.1 MFS family permease [Rhizobium sp. BK289]MBB3414335.1 MFS family permease [Rhizobium sp. BK284]MBB3482223.1 MFS family permease [Rhizobium sp. BK347]